MGLPTYIHIDACGRVRLLLKWHIPLVRGSNLKNALSCLGEPSHALIGHAPMNTQEPTSKRDGQGESLLSSLYNCHIRQPYQLTGSFMSALLHVVLLQWSKWHTYTSYNSERRHLSKNEGSNHQWASPFQVSMPGLSLAYSSLIVPMKSTGSCPSSQLFHIESRMHLNLLLMRIVQLFLP